MLLWFEFVLCNNEHPQTQSTLKRPMLSHAPLRNQMGLNASAYIDTKKRDTVAMIPAIGNVSHFLNNATIGEDVPLHRNKNDDKRC